MCCADGKDNSFPGTLSIFQKHSTLKNFTLAACRVDNEIMTNDYKSV